MINNILVLDLETDSVDLFTKDIVGFSYTIGGSIHYCKENELHNIKPYLEAKNWLKVCHNLKFEYQKLKAYGIHLSPPYYDTQIACWLLGMGVKEENSDGSIKYKYGLKKLAEHWLEYKGLKTYKDLAKEYGHKDGRKHILAKTSEIPVDVLSNYCKKDVNMTYQLYKFTYPKLVNENLLKVFEKIEMPLIPILAEMELNGVKLDKKYLIQLKQKLTEQIADIDTQLEIYL